MNCIYSFIALLFPEFCPGCGNRPLLNEEKLCPGCLLRLPFTGKFRNSIQLENCFPDPSIRIDAFASLLFFRKGGITQAILHRIKYKGDQGMALFFGRMMGRELIDQSFVNDDVVLIPVPLHPEKAKKRGYNQSELLSMGISAVTGIPVHTGVLIRKKMQESQTLKTRLERFENLKNAFASIAEQGINGKRLILVDDVFTTGATTEACILALQRQFPASGISVITLAFALN